MIQLEGIISDRGSRYSVSSGVVRSREDIKAFLKILKKSKKYAKATHNSYAAVLTDGGGIKNDDGESGAGMIILRMLEREAVFDRIVVVTRWYEGVHLGGDRFRHVQTAVKHLLDNADGAKQSKA